MKKIFIKIICWFIPSKQLRHKVRSKFIKSNNSTIENKIDSICQDINFIKDFINKKFGNENYIYSLKIKNDIFYISDTILADYYEQSLMEEDEYKLSEIDFKKGDIVIDIGGNIGLTSIFLAKKFPFLKIYAFEPVKENYDNFIKNIKLNGIPNEIITVENKAVTKDGRPVEMFINNFNKHASAISNVYCDSIDSNNTFIESVTLDSVFEKYNIKKVKLLKIDCEGSEYEIFYNTKKKYLKTIQMIRGEFHSGSGDIDNLESFLRTQCSINDIIVERA